MRSTVVLFAAIFLTIGASGQEVRSEVSVQGTGVFTKDSTGNNTLQRGTETGGVLAGYRYRLNRWLAVETVYGYDRNSQQYFTPAGVSRVQANVHQATGGFVVNLPSKAGWRVSPYLLAEGGALVFDPTNNNTTAGVQRQAVGTFVYGGGADFPLIRHLSLRTEYRGLVYNTPNFGVRGLNTDRITHTAQPSAGLVFRF
jgi:outer membrane immunogenic protein